MPESRGELRVVYPPGSGRGSPFRRLAEVMEAQDERVRQERMLYDVDAQVDRELRRLAMLKRLTGAGAQARRGASA